ncbi:MAG: NAD(P)/FAD-dependent oxidoreductase [Candidatus Pedobacter colombiensis]|uniref:NAD(P)/FAD-dependent oxidoreductase n=1 Tax=Candidatus Pedobacter colombiensis TaxID=3121371 RepID=A0AAJ5W648_9SPHI|nr:NAD(P)/FAD-dependent oxidoreductase [Pedobacter sp.]WEK17684.1 MAG: NAD(P)/FAD-dependent oxidoreductase [Pedobacter sp.]
MKKNQNYDVVIIGGSYAGLSAALALGRAIRNVLIIDSGKPCNSQTPHSHNFLTQDGNTPVGIAALGKSEVMQYPTIEFLADLVTAVKGENNNFDVFTSSGKVIKARKLLFSTGVKDQMPDIPGFANCWGISVIHCPYCHGYEFKDQVTGILANGDTAHEMALLINNWTKKLSVFTNGRSELTEAQLQMLTALKIDVIEKPLREIEHKDGSLNQIIFGDGSRYALKALYARLPFEQHCVVPKEMGCELNKMGYLQVDELQKTSIAGVYAAGDNTSKFRAVSAAVAAGGKAGAFINHELITQG